VEQSLSPPTVLATSQRSAPSSKPKYVDRHTRPPPATAGSVEDDHLDIDLGSSSFFDDIDPSALDGGGAQAVVPHPAAALSAVIIDGGDTDIPDEQLPLALRLQRQLAREAASAARTGRADNHSPAFR
jgi:hypothetical protein